MATEHAILVQDLIERLPTDHPDLAFLKAQKGLTAAYLQAVREPTPPKAQETLNTRSNSIKINGEYVRTLRQGLNLTQQDLAEEVAALSSRCSRGYISVGERQNPWSVSPTLAAHLAQTLAVNIADLTRNLGAPMNHEADTQFKEAKAQLEAAYLHHTGRDALKTLTRPSGRGEYVININGHQLRALRQSLALSQNKLGELSDLKRGTIANFEMKNPRRVTLDSALSIAAALGVSMDDLTTGLNTSGYQSDPGPRQRGRPRIAPWEKKLGQTLIRVFSNNP